MSYRSNQATQGSQRSPYQAYPVEDARLSRARTNSYAQDPTEPVNATLAARASASHSASGTSRDHRTLISWVDRTIGSQRTASSAAVAGMTPSSISTSTGDSTRGAGSRFGGGR